MTDAGAFFVDSDASILRYYKWLARKRGFFLADDTDWRSLDVRDFLTPVQQVRLDQYGKMRTQLEGLSGSCMADLSRNPGSKVQLGPFMPSLLTTMLLYSFQVKRFITRRSCS